MQHTPHPAARHSTSEAGFTLLELTIILAVIALLISGVLVGQHLITAAEIRKVVSEHDRWKAAASTFQVRYGGLPGDLRNATDFWPEGAGCGDVTGLTLDLSEGVCNGNGDKLFRDTVTSPPRESFFFWNHLSHAELIPGGYYPNLAAAASYDEISPRSVMETHWRVDYISSATGGEVLWPSALDRNIYALANLDGSPPLTPQEAYDIDRKMDDGRPASGIVTAPTGASLMSACTARADGTTPTQATDRNVHYNLAHGGAACTIFIRF